MGFDNREGNDPVIAQLRDHLSQDGAVTTTGTTTPWVVVQKVLNVLCVEVWCREVLSLEPGAEGREHAHRILRRCTCVTLTHHLLGKGVNVGAQRPSGQLLQECWVRTNLMDHASLLCHEWIALTEKTSRIMRRRQVWL